MNYQVLLYCHYTTLEDPAALSEEHLGACKETGLKGRSLVAREGINGTFSGTIEQTQSYIDMMEAHPLFKGIVFKIDPAAGHAFKNMHVRPRPQLVHLGLEEDVNPHELTGRYLFPEQVLVEMQ